MHGQSASEPHLGPLRVKTPPRQVNTIRPCSTHRVEPGDEGGRVD